MRRVVAVASLTLLLLLCFVPVASALMASASVSNTNRTRSVVPSSRPKKKSFVSKIWTAPLDLDTALGLSSNNNNDIEDSSSSSPPPPRGIILNAAVGTLVGAGGIMGFVTKGSKASLMAGGTFGALLLASAAWIAKAKSSRAGNRLGAVVVTLLSYVMGKKFVKSQKFLPSGLIALASGVAVIYNVYEGFLVKRKDNEVTSSSSSDAAPATE